MVVITVKTPAPQAEAKNLQEQKGKAAEIHEQATGRSGGVKISDSAARFRTLVYQDNKKVNRVFDGSKIGAPVEVKNFDKLITGVVKNKNAHPAILRDERFAEFPYYT
ncbi:hypothetical protein GBA52_005401 [Prunus armeniaca]|nr:hypothetical protein GBA52_005401 [Prunus armeniaca]